MPDSKFKGDWQYVRSNAKNNHLLKDRTTFTVADDANGDPSTVTFKDPNDSSFICNVDTKAATDISIKKMNGQVKTHKGRLVILSADAPALMVGSIWKNDSGVGGGDTDIDVFVAVKVS